MAGFCELCELFMFDGFNRLRRLQGIALSKNCVPVWRNPEAYLHPMNVMILAKILLALVCRFSLRPMTLTCFTKTEIQFADDGRHYSYEKYPDVLPDF